MRRQNIPRAFLFVVFFSIGAAALSGSVLCNDFLTYYRNRQLLRSVEQSLERLKSLNADYDVLLQQLKEDPNLFRDRVVPAVMGTERQDANMVYPTGTPEQLNAARKALAEELDRQSSRPEKPEWLVRCSTPRRRTMLFVAGAFLVLISFMWFGSAEKPTSGKDRTD
ncbi:MAG: hypothetical protein ACYTBJ_04500 [Planctomycetota bacterium]|jgi:hypothetical protein